LPHRAPSPPPPLYRRACRYVGEPAALARIDTIADGTEDVRKRLSTIRYSDATDDDKAARYAHYFTDPHEGRLWLGYLETLVAASTTGFAASSPTPTHADYLLLDLLDYHKAIGKEAADALGMDEKLMAPALLEAMPALVAWRKRMVERPGLKAYLNSPARRAK
jgi:glutathione S-transferase